MRSSSASSSYSTLMLSPLNSPAPFLCEALYHGSRPVEGGQSPASIAELVRTVLSSEGRGVPRAAGDRGDGYRKPCRGWRVQLQLDEQRLRVVAVRNDEGFESDSEGSSGSLCDEVCCNATDVKVIHDHVLRLDKLLRQDSSNMNHCNTSSSSSNNSHVIPNMDSSCNKNPSDTAPNIPCRKIPATSVSSTDSASPSGEEPLCSHAGDSTELRKKSPEDGALSSSGAESEDDSSPRLQRQPHQPSNSPCPRSSELSSTSSTLTSPTLAPEPRLLSSSPDGVSGAETFLMSDILYCHICAPFPRVVVVVVKAALPTSLLRAHVLECLTQHAAKTLYSHYYKASNKYKLNRYRNSKRKCDVNKNTNGDLSDNSAALMTTSGINSDVFNSLRNCAVRKDSGNSSLSEAGSVRGSLRSVKSDAQQSTDKNINVIEVRSSAIVDESQPFSLVQHTDCNGITHIEIETGPVSLVHGGSVSSDYSSIISLSTPENNSFLADYNKHGDVRNRFPLPSLNSCPNSLITGQREGTPTTERDKKFRQRQPALLIPDKEEKCKQKPFKIEKDEPQEGRSRIERVTVDNSKARDMGRPPLPPPSSWAIPDRLSRTREVSHTRERRDENTKGKHNKGPAPLPPLPPPRRHPHDSSLLLVPTKSGHELKRSYYPKESHIIRGNKLVRVDFPNIPVWSHGTDPNNNARQYIHYTGGWAHEYHESRAREKVSVNSALRRRSHSKSPARKPISNRYIDAVTTFNISQKLKEISDAVFSTKRSHNNLIVNSLSPVGGGSRRNTNGHQRTGSTTSKQEERDALRPVIKKGRQNRSGEADCRRVTFSAYTTVQLMDS